MRAYPTVTPRRIDVDIMSILGRPNFDEFPRHFHVPFQRNFADRKIHVVFTYFFRRNFGGRNIQFFPRTSFDVISLVEKSTLFPRTFFNVISLVQKSMLFPPFFDVILMVEKYTLFASTFFDGILMGNNSTSFLVKMQVN